ncbi:MAG: hypothetical protein ACTHMS_10190 [Jatrophihabitans sp.]|uniref:hypothetical protein n=1 Tax=Jatrophihabitans sp. TaxID=1932789 RepID=UPI003F7F4932
MNRTEDDLRAALDDLAARADREGAPPATSLIGDVVTRSTEQQPTGHRRTTWLLPLSAAALVVAGVAVASTVGGDDHASTTGPASHRTASAVGTRPPTAAAPSTTKAAPLTPARALADAAAQLDHAPWTEPRPTSFFYRQTTDATTWTSVSGQRAGRGTNADGEPIWISGCRDGRLVSTGESGECTLADVPHYLADAPTVPAAWDAYLEHMAPGSRAAGAQGKIIVQVLHQDLVSPQAEAALLRFTAGCPGLRLVDVQPEDNGRALVGLTCPSMAAGSYGLVLDATTHAFVGFQPVTPDGTPQGRAEVVVRTRIVAAAGQAPPQQ